MTLSSASEAETRSAGAWLASRLRSGDVVLLEGPLGAGKTTLVRGVLEALGHKGPVRSPTFNLLQLFETAPPILHADLYRVKSAHGIGLEDYLETHVSLIEWPDRLGGLLEPALCRRDRISFEGDGRRIEIFEPGEAAD